MFKTDSHRARWLAMLIVLGAWLYIDGILISPDFGHTDIYYFKDSAINFAEGLGLTTRFSYGNSTFTYRDYAQYPPVYPLTFGLYAKAVGVSAAANQAFNSLVAIMVGLAGFLALRPMIVLGLDERYRRWLEPVIAVACVTTGYFYFSYDRPDGLAVAAGIAALMLAIRGTGPGSAVAAGALCALTLFTSPFAGLWTSAAAAIGLLNRTVLLSQVIRRLAWTALGGCAAAAVLLGLLRAALPGWFDGFFGVATGSETHNETGGGYFLALLHGDVHTWWSGFAYSRPEFCVLLIKLCAVAAALTWAIIDNFLHPSRIRHAIRLLPLLLVGPMCLITAPYQSNYATITAALLLAAWASIEAATAGARRGAAVAMLLAFAVNVALTLPFEVRNVLVRIEARESLPRALAYLESHRSELEPHIGYSAVSPTNYILWRQAGLHPLITVYSGFRTAVNRRNLTVLALSYPGSGDPVSPQSAEYVPMNEYSLAYQPAVPQVATVFGHALSRSSQTWESALYRREPSPGW